MTPAALTADELNELKTWVDDDKSGCPGPIRAKIGRLIALYLKLAKDKRNTGDLLKTLRTAMGFIPSSERGSQLLPKR